MRSPCWGAKVPETTLFEMQKCAFRVRWSHVECYGPGMHTFCISIVCLLHFCVPSRRLGFSRTPMNLLLISRFCDFGKVGSSRSRAWTFRVRVRAGMRNRAHASAKPMLFKKSQNCNLRQENIGVREICGRPDGAQKCQKPHFLRCNSVHFAFSPRFPND